MRNRLVRGAGAALLACSAAMASAHTSVGIGIGFGFPGYGYGVPLLPYGGVGFGYYGGYYGGGYGGYGPYGRYGYGYRPWGAQVLIAPPPVGYVVQTAPPPPPPPERAPAPARPDPVIYPRNGQDANQTEYDRQQCNRWATTQPAAVADAAVFQRAIEACMDARGYTLK